jgi:hypothetical protein
MSLFGHQNFAEITDTRYPGERLVCGRNLVLAAQRAATRESLLQATEKELGKIAAQAAAGRVKDADKIGVKVGKVIDKRKVGKHFITDIADGRLSWRRDEEKVAAKAELDGIYVIRTSAAEENSGPPRPLKPTRTSGTWNAILIDESRRHRPAADLPLPGIPGPGARAVVHARRLPHLAPAPGARPAHFHR